MTVHFLKGASARQLEEIQQQNNLVDHDAGLKCFGIWILRYESSTLILYKELSSSIFQSCQSVSQASVTPVQISTLFNI